MRLLKMVLSTIVLSKLPSPPFVNFINSLGKLPFHSGERGHRPHLQGNAAIRRVYREPNWITAISDRGYNNVSLL